MSDLNSPITKEDAADSGIHITDAIGEGSSNQDTGSPPKNAPSVSMSSGSDTTAPSGPTAEWEQLMNSIPEGRVVEPSVITDTKQMPRESCGGPKVFWIRRTSADTTSTPNAASTPFAKNPPPTSCFQGFTGVDNSSEIPESELTSVPLETKEQRLDWRDFLCEMVASNNAQTLFNCYDVDAEAPNYSRPPPSVRQVATGASIID